MLVTDRLSYSYGKICVLRQVSLEVKARQITAILGPNGAGKSTLVNVIAGLLTPTTGRIYLDGHDITTTPAHERMRRGISIVPERRRLFDHLTVLENLKAGALTNWGHLEEKLEEVFALLPLLKERRRQIVSTMSGGEQQVVALARGLMSSPSVLVLDEPLLGVQPSIVLDLIRDFKKISELGTSVLLVEQNFFQVSKIMDAAYIMEHGEVTLSGATAEVIGNPAVRKAYLGV
jgi:branched-chain amino acid transport system ATP-binding protein